MQIKKLKLHGFKSFPDKTEINLNAPITALVGPNGCGKSNVVDAIKWVLGSQSPKSLGADQMEDVIFHGSSSRKPLGFAKAEFILDNSDGKIDLDYSEVSIGRKLYRSGESQYLINGEEVRLKDVNELLYDTGIGVENYSLIEQGKIDRVLNSSATERRELIEEAAGISTFQARRREAERKLDRVQDDLTDVQNVLDELKKDIHSLQTQAGKAKKYKEHKQKLEEKKLLLYVDKYQHLVEKEERLHQQWQEAKDERGEIEDKMSSVRNEEQELTQNITDLNEKLSSLKETKTNTEKKLINLDNRITTLENRRASTKKEYQRLSEEDLEDLAAQIEELDDEIEQIKKDRKSNEKKRQQLEREQSDLQEQMNQLKSTLTSYHNKKSQLDDKLTELRQNREDKKQSVRQISDRRERIKETIKEAYDRKRKLTSKLDEHQNDLENIQAEIDNNESEIEQLQGGVAVLRRASRKKFAEYTTIQQELERCEEVLSEMNSRLQYLESLEEKQAGLSKATRKILNDHPPDGENGVLGLLGSQITFTELGHQTIQGILDPFLKFIAVRDWQTAKQVIESTRDVEGNVGILVRSALARASAGAKEIHRHVTARKNGYTVFKTNASPAEDNDFPSASLRHAGRTVQHARAPLLVARRRSDGFKPLTQYLKTSPAFQKLILELLSSFGYNGSVQTEKCSEDLFPPAHAVARTNGMISNQKGVIYSRADTQVEDSVIDRRRNLKKLRQQKSTKSDKLHELEQQSGTLQDGLEEIHSTINNSLSNIYEKKVNLNHQRERVSWLQEQIEEHKQERTSLENQISEKKEKRRELSTRRKNLESALESLNEEESSIKEDVQKLEEKIENVQKDLDREQEKKQELDVRKAKLEEKIQNANSLISRHKQDREKANERIETVRNRLSDLEDKREEIHDKLEEKRSSKKALEKELEETDRKISKIQDRISKLKKRQNKKEKQREEIRESYKDLQRESNQLKMNLQAARKERETLEERADEQLDQNIEEAMDTINQPDEEINREKLKEEVSECKRKIDRMGNVNLAALEQLEEKKDRVEEIEAQEEDLKKSRRRLQRIIRKMKKESHKRFKETFEQGKENFNDLFRKLFGGGKATIEAVYDEEEDSEEDEVLPDQHSGNGTASSENLLECGIEIKARPPGKETKNLSLLSGGERAMTSFALMMALFMLNPSAICILDEADAPLDESNLDLFIGLLDEFTDLTQFLVITHKKKTITAADRVYGLTMQEDGVSQLISMDMEKRIPEEYLQNNPEEQPGSVAGTVAE